ncbi:putative signal transduction histidine kinase [Actinobacteria bacterium OK074]|nr:putative signal transduction histidine kinase [Actinobacteria bacterium OK074]
MRGTAWWKSATRRHPTVTDAALLTGLCVVTAVTIATRLRPLHVQLGALTIALAAYGALLFHRRRPFLVLGLTTAAAVAYMVVSRSHGWVLAAPLIVMYRVASSVGDRRRMLICSGLAVVALTGAPVLMGSYALFSAEELAVLAACGVALTAGEASRSRRDRLGDAEERAHRAEREHEHEARRRVTEERLRIARELHDIIGHHLAVITVQAGVATHALGGRSSATATALGHIRQASRAALEDLRDTVDLLRQPGDEGAPTGPNGSLAGLGELVGIFTGTGMRIEHRVEGTVRRLPPAVDLTAYRVIQESLTNVRKHAGDVGVRLLVSYEPSGLRVLVENDGYEESGGAPDTPVSVARDGTAHGILGMRERVTALGGRFDASPVPGGFRVSATLPRHGDDPT